MGNPTMNSDDLQTLIDKLVGANDAPGASAAVLHDGELAVGASGVLNLNTGVEVTPDSVFQIGSVTKVYNATLVMQLVDEGLLDLDEPAVAYLPEFRLADPEALDLITVRHLLTHTSGIDGGDYIEDFGSNDDGIERYVASLAGIGLIHPVGRFHSYCNAATIVAGRIVEVLTGLYWRDALRTRLLEPLGLEETVSRPEEAILFRASVGHMKDPGRGDEIRVFPTWQLPPSNAPAGSAINASARDVARFGAFHLRNGLTESGERLLSESAAKAMREVQFPEVTRKNGGAQGLGWGLREQGSLKIASHGGGVFGQYAQLMTLPDHGISLCVLTNGPGGGAVMAGITNEVLSRLGDPELAEMLSAQQAAAATKDAPAPELAETDIDLARYAGEYSRTGLTTTIEVGDGVLSASTKYHGYLERMPPQPAVTLKPVSATTFVALGPEGKPAGQVSFEDFDPEGRPEYFIMGRVARRSMATG